MARANRSAHRGDPHPGRIFSFCCLAGSDRTNALINLAYVGALFLAAAVLSLGVGLIRAARIA